MNQDQINITGMHSTVADYLSQNQPVWSGIKAINDTVAVLTANNQVIASKAGTQEMATEGMSESKRQAKHDLEDKILEIADQLFSLASKTKNATLIAQTHLTASLLDHMDDGALENVAGNIAKLAADNLAVLADYGVAQTDIDELNTLLTAFSGLKTAPRTAIAARSAQTKTLSQAISDNQSLLKNQLDKQMTKFKRSNPDFYAGYQTARVIVDRRSHHKGAQTTAPANPPGTTTNS